MLNIYVGVLALVVGVLHLFAASYIVLKWGIKGSPQREFAMFFTIFFLWSLVEYLLLAHSSGSHPPGEYTYRSSVALILIIIPVMVSLDNNTPHRRVHINPLLLWAPAVLLASITVLTPYIVPGVRYYTWRWDVDYSTAGIYSIGIYVIYYLVLDGYSAYHIRSCPYSAHSVRISRISYVSTMGVFIYGFVMEIVLRTINPNVYSFISLAGAFYGISLVVLISKYGLFKSNQDRFLYTNSHLNVVLFGSFNPSPNRFMKRIPVITIKDGGDETLLNGQPSIIYLDETKTLPDTLDHWMEDVAIYNIERIAARGKVNEISISPAVFKTIYDKSGMKGVMDFLRRLEAIVSEHNVVVHAIVGGVFLTREEIEILRVHYPSLSIV